MTNEEKTQIATEFLDSIIVKPFINVLKVIIKEGADVPVRSASGLDKGFGVRRLFKIVVLHRELCFVTSFDRESVASSMSLPMAAKLAIVQLIDCRADH